METKPTAWDWVGGSGQYNPQRPVPPVGRRCGAPSGGSDFLVQVPITAYSLQQHSRQQSIFGLQGFCKVGVLLQQQGITVGCEDVPAFPPLERGHE